MRIKLACLTLAVASLTPLALPAAAQQSYNSACNQVKNDRSAMGAVLGGLAGGLIGNQSAGRGARDEGTALGLVVGGLVGSQIAKGDIRCPSNVYTAAPQYGYDPYADQYAQERYNSGYSAYSQPYSDQYGTYSGGYSAYGNNTVQNARSVRTNRSRNYSAYSHSDLAGGAHDSYNRDYDLADRECADAKQITRLPDGTEIHRPIEACREAYYGDWSVGN